MTDARATYRLHAALSVLGLLAAILGLGVALGEVNLAASPAAIAAACWSFVMPQVTPGSLAVLALASLGLIVVARGARSATTRATASRRSVQRATARHTRLADTDVWITDEPQTAAYTAGLLRPRIYLTASAVAALGPGPLAAVIAHEAHHVARRDPLRLLVAYVMADALCFLPVLNRLAMRYAAQAELAADAAAVAASGGPRPLAAALLAFENHTPTSAVGIAPERVDHLLGTPARYELPTALLGAAVLTITLIFAITFQLTATPADHVETTLPTLVEQICFLLRAMLPIIAAALALTAIRRLLTRS
jgi:Zn-dependent protease with chaperone function